MKKENKTNYKITLDLETNLENDLRLIKLKKYESLRHYNSEKFSRILADKIIFINGNTGRVDSKFNPHIAKDLMENNCNNWRVDYWQSCIEKEFRYTVDKKTDYIVDFENGTVKRKLSHNERICKHCDSIVNKSEIIGAHCEKCLTAQDGLAYRFSYHTFGGKYTIREKKVNQSKTALFGTEIERDYLGGWNGHFNYDLKRAMIETVKILYGNKLNNERVNRKAVFMRDSSLNQDGIEWITFPQTYRGYKQEADKIEECLKIMRKYNFGNSDKVGNHIHINRKFFGDTEENLDESRFAGAKMALLLNEFWDEFIVIAKRKGTDYTTKPTQNKKDKIFSLVAKTLNNELSHSVAVNLQHKETIEIRIWGGINSVEDLLLYLDLTQALATFAKKKSLESCQKAKLIDIFKFLEDKQEHLTEIKKRLNDKNITNYDKEIDELLKSEVK